MLLEDAKPDESIAITPITSVPRRSCGDEGMLRTHSPCTSRLLFVVRTRANHKAMRSMQHRGMLCKASLTSSTHAHTIHIHPWELHPHCQALELWEWPMPRSRSEGSYRRWFLVPYGMTDPKASDFGHEGTAHPGTLPTSPRHDLSGTSSRAGARGLNVGIYGVWV